MLEQKAATSQVNPGSGKKIFISYSRKDLRSADRIVAHLEDGGLRVWIDREDISAGQAWRVQIVQAIDECDAFILLLSPNSAISDNVRKEIDLAQDANRSIFILTLQPVTLPANIRYQLTGLQQIDVKKLGMNDALQRLVGSLHKEFETKKSASPSETRQAEIIIKGIDLATFSTSKQELLVEFLAELSQTDKSGLQIMTVRSGSVRVTIDMPATAAIQLKTLALNRDERFQQLSITALRLAGNKLFINVQTGVLTPSGKDGGPPSAPGATALTTLFLIATAAVILFLLTLAVIFTVREVAQPALTDEPIVPSTGQLMPSRTPAPPTDTVTQTSTPTEIPAYCSISVRQAQMHQGPDLQYFLTRHPAFSRGEQLVLLARSRVGNWYYFRAEDGTEGWLAKDWVECNFDTLDIPVIITVSPVPTTVTPRPRPPTYP